jgi:hypothetical protein
MVCTLGEKEGASLFWHEMQVIFISSIAAFPKDVERNLTQPKTLFTLSLIECAFEKFNSVFEKKTDAHMVKKIENVFRCLKSLKLAAKSVFFFFFFLNLKTLLLEHNPEHVLRVNNLT